MADELALRFIGYDLVSPVAKTVGTSIEGVAAKATGVGSTLASTASNVGAAGLKSTEIYGAGLVGTLALIKDGTGAAVDFEAALQLLETHANMPTDPAYITAMTKGLKELAPLGYNQTEAAQAMYYVQSSGIHDVTKSLAVEAAAMKTAKMTGADLKDTTYALVSTMNALPGAFDDPIKYAGALNAIVGSGILTFDELNMSLKSGIFGTGAVAGQNIQEMGALIDSLTRQGYAAPAAAQTVRNLILQISNVKPASAAAFAAMNLDQQKVVKDMTDKGAIYALTEIKKHMADLDKPGQLMFLNRVFRGTKGAGQVGSILEGMDMIPSLMADINNNVDNFGNLWNIAAGTARVQTSALAAEVYNAKAAFGTAMLPVLKAVLAVVTPLVTKFGDWITAHQSLVTKISVMAVKFFSAATAISALVAGGGYLVAFILNPMSLMFIAVGLAAMYVVKHWSTLQPMLQNFWKVHGPGIIIALKEIRDGAIQMVRTIEPYISKFIYWFISILPAIERVANYLFHVFAPGIATQLRGPLESLGSWLHDHVLVNLEKFGSYMTGPGNNGVKTLGGAIIQALPAMIEFAKSLGRVGGAIWDVLIPAFQLFGPMLINALAFLQDHGHLIEGVLDLMIARFLIMQAIRPFQLAIEGALGLYGIIIKLMGLNTALTTMQIFRGAGGFGNVGASGLAWSAGEAMGGFHPVQAAKAAGSAVGRTVSTIGKFFWQGGQGIIMAITDIAKWTNAHLLGGVKRLASDAKEMLERGAIWLQEKIAFIVKEANKLAEYLLGKMRRIASDIAEQIERFAIWVTEKAEWLMKEAEKAAEYIVRSAERIAMDVIEQVKRFAIWVVEQVRFLVMQAERVVAYLLANSIMLIDTIATAGAMAIAWIVALGPIGLIIAAIALLGLGFATNFLGMRDKAQEFFQWFTDHWQILTVLMTGGAAGPAILIISQFEHIRAAFETVFNFISDHWRLLMTILLGPVVGVANLISQHFGAIGGAIERAFAGTWMVVRAILNAMISAVDWVIRGLNNIRIPSSVLGVSVPLIGGAGVNIPQIAPLAAAGAYAERATNVTFGEAGAELITPEPKFKQWSSDAFRSAIGDLKRQQAPADTTKMETLLGKIADLLTEMNHVQGQSAAMPPGTDSKIYNLMNDVRIARNRGIKGIG